MKTVVLLSGGLDSAVVLADAIDRGRTPYCLSFDYGQRHRRELRAATNVAGYYSCPHAVVALPAGVFAASALTGGGDVPRGLHFEDPAQAATVVPGRNLLFAAYGVAHALRVGAAEVLLGCHGGDRAVYPDCRPSFLDAIDHAADVAYDVAVLAPFKAVDKAGVVARGRTLRVPFGLTWSCYSGDDEPCGECGACVERAAALTVASSPPTSGSGPDPP